MSDRFEHPQALHPDAFRRIGQQALDIAARHLETVVDRPIKPMPDAETRQIISDQPLPVQGHAPEDILGFLEREIMPHARGNGNPGFMGWVISPPAHMAVLTELPGVAMDSPCGGSGQGATYLEWTTIRWIKEMLGYDHPGSHGIFVSGGSMANLTALAGARHAAANKHGWNMRRDGMRKAPDFTVYTSRETHACVTKSMELMGMGHDAIRLIDTDDTYSMNINKLRSVVESDIEDGRVPFCVVASAGTVNTGAIDDLDAVADLCAKHDIWFHVDGAYGAFGALDPDKADAFSGMKRADSIALDPHKWLSVPFDCGCVLVRDGQNLRDTFSLIPAYIRGTDSDSSDVGSPHEYSFQLSHAFRALKVWSTLMHVGVEGFRDTVHRHNTMAANLAAEVSASDDLELLAPASLSIVCFRYAPPALAGDNERLNTINRTLIEELQAEGRIYPSHTELEGRFSLRANIFHYATDQSDLDLLLASV
jgi:glutamate/tyrosine decarboxylase-like PLP-dependent enzyme